MKLFGRISGAEMVMMIESRTTDHFVSPATMEKLWNGAESHTLQKFRSYLRK